MRIVSETWSLDLTSFVMDVAGRPGRSYELAVWDPQQIKSVTGATLGKPDGGRGTLKIDFPGSTNGGYVHTKVMLTFSKETR
jgi:hypothetical protein